MKESKKATYYILMTLGVLGLIASIYNTFWNEDVENFMILIGFISSVSLIFGAQQLKQNELPPSNS